MDTAPTLSLVDRLQIVAALWTEAQDPPATLARLGKTVVNDGAFFDRVGAVRGPTTTKLEQFARFLADPAHWPGGTVPEQARAFAHVTGVDVSASACAGERDAA